MGGLADVTRSDVENELERRGVMVGEPPVTSPVIPPGPTQPVIIVPPGAAPPREPYLPYYPRLPEDTETPVPYPPAERQIRTGPEAAAGERPFPKALLVSGIVLFALIVFAEKGPAKPPGGRNGSARKKTPKPPEEEDIYEF